MGLELIDSKIHFNDNELKISEKFLDISNLAIPFSIMFKKNSKPDIYSGEEIIPFKDKISEFQQILINEFIMDY